MARRVLQAIGCILVVVAVSAPLAASPMDDDQFWQLIDSVKSSDDDGAHASRLSKVLAALDPVRQKAVADIFNRMLVKADKQALRGAASKVLGICSEDCFLYVRAWLVSRGQQDFERVVNHPALLAEVLPAHARGNSRLVEFEKFLYAGSLPPYAAAEGDARVESVTSPSKRQKQRTRKVQDPNSINVPGIGIVSVGMALRHRELGKGIVKALVPGDVIRAVLEFEDGEESFVLLPEFFEKLR
jgi:hypothetical protein